MRIVISDFISLDGVVQAPGGPDEDTDGGFRHGGWSMPFFDPEVMGGFIGSAMEHTDAILQGRRTWSVMADAWPSRSGGDDPFTDWMNTVPKYVVSASLRDEDVARWSPTTIIRPGELEQRVGGAARAARWGHQHHGQRDRRLRHCSQPTWSTSSTCSSNRSSWAAARRSSPTTASPVASSSPTRLRPPPA